MISAYHKGAVVNVSTDNVGDFCVVHSAGDGFGFQSEQLRHFIASNGFGKRLADALQGLAVLIKFPPN
jgi:hypothetical protein